MEEKIDNAIETTNSNNQLTSTIVSTMTATTITGNGNTSSNLSQTIEDYEPEKWEMTTLEKASIPLDCNDVKDDVNNFNSTCILSQSSVDDAQMEKVIDNIVELGGCQHFAQTLEQKSDINDREKEVEHIHREIVGDRNPSVEEIDNKLTECKKQDQQQQQQANEPKLMVEPNISCSKEQQEPPQAPPQQQQQQQSELPQEDLPPLVDLKSTLQKMGEELGVADEDELIKSGQTLDKQHESIFPTEKSIQQNKTQREITEQDKVDAQDLIDIALTFRKEVDSNMKKQALHKGIVQESQNVQIDVNKSKDIVENLPKTSTVNESEEVKISVVAEAEINTNKDDGIKNIPQIEKHAKIHKQEKKQDIIVQETNKVADIVIENSTNKQENIPSAQEVVETKNKLDNSDTNPDDRVSKQQKDIHQIVKDSLIETSKSDEQHQMCVNEDDVSEHKKSKDDVLEQDPRDIISNVTQSEEENKKHEQPKTIDEVVTKSDDTNDAQDEKAVKSKSPSKAGNDDKLPETEKRKRGRPRLSQYKCPVLPSPTIAPAETHSENKRETKLESFAKSVVKNQPETENKTPINVDVEEKQDQPKDKSPIKSTDEKDVEIPMETEVLKEAKILVEEHLETSEENQEKRTRPVRASRVSKRIEPELPVVETPKSKPGRKPTLSAKRTRKQDEEDEEEEEKNDEEEKVIKDAGIVKRGPAKKVKCYQEESNIADKSHELVIKDTSKLGSDRLSRKALGASSSSSVNIKFDDSIISTNYKLFKELGDETEFECFSCHKYRTSRINNMVTHIKVCILPLYEARVEEYKKILATPKKNRNTKKYRK